MEIDAFTNSKSRTSHQIEIFGMIVHNWYSIIGIKY